MKSAIIKDDLKGGDKMRKKNNLALRYFMIMIGTIVAAYGMTLAINAGFGGASLAVLWQGIAVQTGITIGEASFGVAVVMIVFVFFYDRKQIQIGTVLYQIIYSFFVDVFSSLHRYPDSKLLCFFLMIVGIVLFAIGSGIYSAADMGRGSYEALTFAFAEKNGWKLGLVRCILDLLMVVVGVLLGGHFGICTVATILLSGIVMQKTVSVVQRLMMSN